MLCDLGGRGLLAGVAPAAALPRVRAAPGAARPAVLRAGAQGPRHAVDDGRAPGRRECTRPRRGAGAGLVAPTVGRSKSSRNVCARCPDLNACDDAIAEIVAPRSRCWYRDGDGPARAVEVASQLLPQLHGVFVCVVAPRHRVRDADLAGELAAALPRARRRPRAWARRDACGSSRTRSSSGRCFVALDIRD